MADRAMDTRAIKARAEAATEGPWETDDHGLDDGNIAILSQQAVYATSDWNHTLARVGSRIAPRRTQDAAFIAAARTDVPALCDALDEARARIELLEAKYAEAVDIAEEAIRALDIVSQEPD